MFSGPASIIKNVYGKKKAKEECAWEVYRDLI